MEAPGDGFLSIVNLFYTVRSPFELWVHKRKSCHSFRRLYMIFMLKMSC